jgi:hypothetical protein
MKLTLRTTRYTATTMGGCPKGSVGLCGVNYRA